MLSPYLERALVEILLLASLAGTLGAWIVLRRLAFYAHAVGTATFPGLVVAVPEGRRTRYELADTRIKHALGDLLGLVLAVDPVACPDSADKGCC